MAKEVKFTANRVRKLRTELKLTQEALADLIGMTSRTLQSMESGSRPITRLQQLALNWLALQGKVKP
jgi:transcriptional regulator with XRE-family HTH domain